MKCVYYIHNRAMDRPHVCKFDNCYEPCVFACNWKLASKRCSCYSCDSWALYAVLDGAAIIRISKRFADEKDACNHIEPSWMENVVVRKCNDESL